MAHSKCRQCTNGITHDTMLGKTAYLIDNLNMVSLMYKEGSILILGTADVSAEGIKKWTDLF